MGLPFSSLEQDLRHLVNGEVHFDEPTRIEYSTAMCMYRVVPVGVVFPVSVTDVTKTMRFCAERGIPIIPRGGATGLVGQAIGLGIIVDFARHMRRIRTVGPNLTDISVEAGCTLNDLNAFLLPLGKHFPVDPQSKQRCTIGGMVATNASGAHGLRYGAMKDQVNSLSVVFSNGEAGEIFSDDSRNAVGNGAGEILAACRSLLERHRPDIDAHHPHAVKNSSGYNIFEALKADSFDVPRLICGSEGTLAIVSGASLKIAPLPRAVVIGVGYFRNYEDTAQATLAALREQPSAIELLDRSYTEVGKGISAVTDALIDRPFATILLFEFEAASHDDGLRAARNVRAQLEQRGLLLDWITMASPVDQEAMWRLREEVSIKLNDSPPPLQKVSVFEDGAVPIQELPSYMAGIKRILEAHRMPFTLYGHAGTGNLHCTTFVEMEKEDVRRNLEEATTEIFDLLTSLGGSLSGEHGDGYVRTPFLERHYGREIYSVFRHVKEIFDPNNLLNPGKIIGPQDGLFLHDIKYA